MKDDGRMEQGSIFSVSWDLKFKKEECLKLATVRKFPGILAQKDSVIQILGSWNKKVSDVLRNQMKGAVLKIGIKHKLGKEI